MIRRQSELTVALVHRALEGDRGAIRTMVDALTPVIQARAARALQRFAPRDIRAEVEDVTQSVLGNLFADRGRALLQWDPERGLSLESFVGMRAEHEVASILRTRARSPLTHAPTPDDELDRMLPNLEDGPEIQTASRELLQEVLARLLEQLNDRGRELFELLVVEERPVEEVCQLTSLTTNAVYQWRGRLGRLGRQIAEELMSEKSASPHSPPKVPAS